MCQPVSKKLGGAYIQAMNFFCVNEYNKEASSHDQTTMTKFQLEYDQKITTTMNLKN